MRPHLRTATTTFGIAVIAAAALATGAGAAQADDSDGALDGAATSSTSPAEEVSECSLQAANVSRGEATFTVGPVGCDGEVGPISFSAFFLPGGMREPYEDQVLIAHHESNGSFYGEGSYQLTIDIGTPCNWQTDLYFGVDLMPKFRGLIAYDFDEREVCVDETTTTTTTSTTSTTSTTTTTMAANNPTTTTIVGAASPTTTTTTIVDAESPAPTTSVASAGPVPGPADGGTLPSTGPWEVSVLTVLAGILVAAGLLVRRLAHVS